VNDLKPNYRAQRSRKRVGRGRGSTFGKTSGRGMNGQKCRSGARIPAWFEGGQNPLHRRVPKRGFTNIFTQEWQTLNINTLISSKEFEKWTEIGVKELTNEGLVRKKRLPIKLLAGNKDGDQKLFAQLKNKQFHVHGVSKAAREILEKHGASVEVIEFKNLKPKQEGKKSKESGGKSK